MLQTAHSLGATDAACILSNKKLFCGEHLKCNVLSGEGECRNLVSEADEKRQCEIQSVAYSTEGPSSSVPWASSRNAPPGFLGGHV